MRNVFSLNMRWIALFREWIFIGTTGAAFECLFGHVPERAPLPVSLTRRATMRRGAAWIFLFAWLLCPRSLFLDVLIESKDTAAPVCIKQRFRSVGAKNKCLKLKKKKKSLSPMRPSGTAILQPSHNFTTSCVGVGSLKAWWFGQRGGGGEHVQPAWAASESAN